MTSDERALALNLFDIGAVKFGGFKLKLHETQPDAPLSPIYFNLRTPKNPKPGPLTLEVMGTIGQVINLTDFRLELSFDHIAGIPNAGNPFAEALNHAVKCDDFKPFNRLHFHKEDGTQRRIGSLYGENFSPGESVLLIDDLITQAGTKLEAIKSVKQAGLKVAGILVLIDREQGGKQQLEKAGCKVSTVYQLSNLLTFYVEEGRITKEKADEVQAYIQANSLS